MEEAGRGLFDSPPLVPEQRIVVVDTKASPILWSPSYGEWFPGGDAVPALTVEGWHLPESERPHARAARGETFSMRVCAAAGDGRRHEFLVRGQPLMAAGAPAGGILTFEQLDELRPEVEREFLLVVGHELRTPLTVLLGFLQMIERVLPDDPAPLWRRYLDMALAEGRTLDMLISRLLRAARLEARKVRLNRELTDLAPLVEKLVERAGPLGRGQRLALTRRDPGAVVVGDSTAIEQILMDLVSNALEYAPHTSHVDLRVIRSGDEAVVEVQDYGPGMSREQLEHIFEPFYQAPGVERTSRHGLGLGLYLAQRLAALQGGSVRASSERAHGATFSLVLPLAVESDPSGTRVWEAVEPDPGGKSRRQIGDDDASRPNASSADR